jgi:hypothetical protein
MMPLRSAVGAELKHDDYPALFKSADKASNGFQQNFLRLIVLEYSLLVIAAVLAVPSISNGAWHAITAIILILAVATLLWRSAWKPEQKWYKARALAESVKTLTWRYAMAAHPFDKPTLAECRQELRENLEKLLETNPDLVSVLPSDASTIDQVTEEMDRLRGLSVNERGDFYQRERVLEQQRWYQVKAAANRQLARQWVGASVVGYVAAIAFSLARIAFPTWEFWPVEPLIVVAGAIVGWVQIKKFNELAAAYTVTAHEIGLIKITLDNADTVQSFSDYVNEAEGAFSREHTLWLARQAN